MRYRGLLVLLMAASAPSTGLRAQPQRVAPLAAAEPEHYAATRGLRIEDIRLYHARL